MTRVSFCLMTNAASGRVGAIVEHVRPAVDEVVLAVDDRTAPDEVAALARIADTVVLFPYREPADLATPWIFSLCSGDWILNADHDEIPSRALLEALPELVAADDVSHYWLQRRWLWPDAGHHLDEPPWAREPVPKLVRNDPLTMRFSDEFHRPFAFAGPSRFVEHQLWHADLLLKPFESRREKTLAYERERRGMRIAGVAHNAGFYLPELRPDARVAALPDDERALVERVLSAPDLAAPTQPWPATRRADVEELDSAWSGGRQASDELHRGAVEPVERVERLTAGVQQTIHLRVRNDSQVAWPYGQHSAPAIRLAYRWHGIDDGRALRTAFPADLRPGETQTVPLHVVPPAEPGRYRLTLDLVHEHVRWFDCGVDLDVEVVPRRRVALVGAGPALEVELDRLQFEPELEPVLVGRGVAIPVSRWEHPRLPGLHEYLHEGAATWSRRSFVAQAAARTRTLVRRARSLRAGVPARPLPHGAEELLAGLASCERLIVVAPDWNEGDAVARELMRIAATVHAAAALGLRVEVRPGALDAADRRVDRLVRSVVERRAVVA